MTDDPKFAAMAERTRLAMGEMTMELAAELRGTAMPTQVLSAMTAGCTAQAVEFHFDACVQASVPFGVGREELDRQVDTYWKQALTRHLTAQAREKTSEGEAEPEGDGGGA